MSFQIFGLSDMVPAPPTARVASVDTFRQLQHLLEQSLQDIRVEAHGLESGSERELTQSLQRLSERLRHILEGSKDFNHNKEVNDVSFSELSFFPAFSPSASRNPVNLLTSSDGVVVMANQSAVEALGMNLAHIGRMSIREWMSPEEWQVIQQHLKIEKSLQKSESWVVSLERQGEALPKMICSVMPMLDASGNGTVWHWDLRLYQESLDSHPFAPLVQSLQADLLNGQSLDGCLKRICEGLVQTFGYPFVWMATVHDIQRIQLRAQALSPALDWERQGPLWWSSISRQEILAQACVAPKRSFVSGETCPTSEFSWFPQSFYLQETCWVPLQHGEFSGLLVVCSGASNAFDTSVREWLEGLGLLIEGLMARGMEIEQLRLQKAAMASVHDAVCLTDPQGRIEWVNQAYLKLLGVTLHQVLGTPFRSFPHAQMQEHWSNAQLSQTEIKCVKSEIMEKGGCGESLVLDQVLTPLENDQGKITHFVITLHDVTSRAVAEMQMKHQAYHDALTDLPNRVMFEDRLHLALAQARRDGTLLALLFLDLDNFKSINDHYGHQMGDRLLRVVAKRLVACVRTTDTVSRLCGDEFTIILQGLDRIQDIRQVAQKIVDCLTAPIHLRGEDIPVQISIGIAVSPKDSIDPHRLLAIADQAMYQAKDYGGQRWYFATSEWNME